MDDTSLKRGVISLYHDSPMAGHPGISNTTWAIARDFWWPAMKKDVTEYIKGCTTCQARKNQLNKPKPPPFPIPSDTYSTPFTSIAMDFIVKLPLSDSYDTILTITDTFLKASIFIPCNETINAEQTAKLYANYVLPHYGLPHRIISDRDPHFTSVFSRELCHTLGIKQNISTAYHLQTDGQSECTNCYDLSFALLHADTSDCLLSSLPHPLTGLLYFYDLILLMRSHLAASCSVRYTSSVAIRSPMYDTYLRATPTTTSSIGGVQIPIDLVSRATDSLRRSAVVLKLYQ